MRSTLPRIQAETLVLSCAQDAMVPPHHQQQLTELIDDSHLEFLPGGHGVVFEHPEAVVNALRNFLD